MFRNWFARLSAGMLALGVALAWVGLPTPDVGRTKAAEVSHLDDAKADASADKKKTSISEEHKAVLDRVATYLYGPVDNVGPELKRLGYEPPPAFSAAQWRRLPAAQKLAAFYWATKTNDPANNAERAMALLVESLSRQRDPVAADADPVLQKYRAFARKDAILVDYFAKLERMRPDDPPPELPIRFKNPDFGPNKPLPALPAEIHRTIRAIERFTSTGLLGSQTTILIRYFKVKPDEALTRLLSRNSFVRVMEARLAELPAEERPAILRNLVTDAAQIMPEIATDKVLGRWLDRPPPAARAVARPTRPKSPKPGAADVAGGKRYEDIMKGPYKEPGERKFESMGSKVRGFGGGVFGNKVDGSTLPKPSRLTFEPDKDKPTEGKLVVEFADMTKLVYPDVLAEDVWIANELIYKQSWKKGEGIGLVGLKTFARNYIEFGPDGIEFWERSEVALNPAMVDTEMGHSALVTDMLPRSGRSHLLSEIERRRSTKTRRTVEALFQSRQRLLDRASYVFVDEPMRLTKEKDQLIIQADKAGFPETILRKAFVELRLQTNKDAKRAEDRYDSEFALDFYGKLPILIDVSADLARINRFAPVLALFRWARENDVPECGNLPVKPKSEEPTPNMVASADSTFSSDRGPFYRPIRSLNEHEARADMVVRMGERIELLEADERLTKAFDKMKPIRKDVELLLQKATDEGFAIELRPLKEDKSSRLLRYWSSLKVTKRISERKLKTEN